MSLPPLNGLLALEAVIRLGSVRRAAEELCISQPAVSQRLRGLEAHFGRPLITRTPTGFDSAPEVDLYAGQLRHALAEIRNASERFRRSATRPDNRLSVALLASFAQRWLIPRLSEFQNGHPQIDVQLMTTSDPAELVHDDADIAIRCGAGPWPGYRSRFLIENRIFPVASPRLLAEHPLRQPSALREVVLITVDAAPRRDDWRRWLQARALADLQPRAWRSFASSSLALEAAAAGLGVAITHTPFVVDSLAAGHLARPFDDELADPDGDFHVVRHDGASPSRRIDIFEDWLYRQVSAPEP